ncbi:integrase arm-type DNA-binding domain-containing protein [Pararhizobium sp. PWRC1-1]|uniref:integrase arm-type DNA-binding domain-containing protein n=1 Tax=Pararhizobium sp. PWRC1-1 TaxID=2804566 RepID=UPI003CEDBF29
MRREYLRDTSVLILEGEAERYEVRDVDIKNFAVRVGPKTKVCYLLGRFGKATRMKIGTFGPKMKTEDARQIAKDWNAMIRNGVDIVEHRETERHVEALSARSTFRSVMEDYLAFLDLRDRNRTVEEDRAFARRNIINPETNPWMNLPISKVTDEHIADLVTRIQARGAKVQARKTLQMIRRFYKWTMLPNRRGKVGLTSNPVADLTPDSMSLKTKSRTRHFRSKEVRAFLVASAGVLFEGKEGLRRAVSDRIPENPAGWDATSLDLARRPQDNAHAFFRLCPP